jgi:hypothetical protein
VNQLGAIHLNPFPKSRRIDQLHWLTEDGFPEVYLVLREHWDRWGRDWVQLRIPGRPNGRIGWVRRFNLGPLNVTFKRIVVNRSRLRMYLYVHDRVVWSAPVGVGAPGTPTPSGHFWIRERWAITDPSSGYWPVAFGTADYSTLTDWPGGGVVGIHGPYGAASAIPGYISHGCIRLETWDDGWLGQHVGVGTPLQVI